MKGSFEQNKIAPTIGQKIWIVSTWIPPFEDTVTVVYESDRLSTGSVDTKYGWHEPLNTVFDHCPDRVTRTDEYGSFQDWE